MAKKGKPKASTAGPYINAAVFCEYPIEDTKDMISVIKIFDRIEAELPAGFKAGERVIMNTWFFVAAKAGDAKGKHKLELVLIEPNGTRGIVSESDLLLLGDEHGQFLRANLNFSIQAGGLYWMDVLIDGKSFTRTPLRVVFRQPSKATEKTPLASTNPHA
jgi:hypothetical protein